MPSVLCFGDSNTHGTKPMPDLLQNDRWDRTRRWPGVLARLRPDWEVVEEGLPGRTVNSDDPVNGAALNGRKALYGALNSHRPLDAVVILLGTNDTKVYYRLPAETIALSLARMAREVMNSMAGIDRAAPRLLVLAPVPVLETGCLAAQFAGAAAISQDLGREIAWHLPGTGAEVIDLAPIATVSPVDGVHLDEAAHAAIGATVAHWLSPIG